MICLRKNGYEMYIDEKGAEMRAFRTPEGRDCLWSGDAAVWKGVAPVLFPAIGALKNKQVTIGGQAYAVPRHGFVRDMQFAVTEQGEDFVTLALHETPETRQVFPFAFALSVTHRFADNGFETRFTVENHSSREMPFLLGGHPGFACPMQPGEAFEDYVVRFQKPEKGETVLCTTASHLLGGTEKVNLGADQRTLPLNHADFDRLDTFIFAGLNSRSVDLVHKDTGKGLRLSFDMDVLAIWTKPGANAPYVCLEPWQGLPAYENETGRFEDKPYHVALSVGRAYTCGYAMQLLKNGAINP